MAITALLSDLIFESKVRATAAALGADVRLVRDERSATNALTESSGLIVDLNATGCDALAFVRAARAAHPSLRIVGFLSHVQVELAREARAAGCDEVLPRSKFTETLADILARLA